MQKITAALRMVAYEDTGDFMDEYIRIGETIAMESLKKFIETLVSVFFGEYLRSPNANDILRLLNVAEQRGFPGMLGSIDCMHWKWKNRPTVWKDMYSGHVREPTIILEAIASYDLWICHAFFRMLMSHNSINVLESFGFHGTCSRFCSSVNYTINDNNYTIGYYLADGINPEWKKFVKTIPSPQRNKKKFFVKAQEAARKDVERAFEVLQQRFAIIRGPSRMFKAKELTNIMKECVIVHKMIIEDESNYSENNQIESDQLDDDPLEFLSNHTTDFAYFVQRHHQIKGSAGHHQLQEDLIEH